VYREPSPFQVDLKDSEFIGNYTSLNFNALERLDKLQSKIGVSDANVQAFLKNKAQKKFDIFEALEMKDDLDETARLMQKKKLREFIEEHMIRETRSKADEEIKNFNFNLK